MDRQRSTEGQKDRRTEEEKEGKRLGEKERRRERNRKIDRERKRYWQLISWMFLEHPYLNRKKCFKHVLIQKRN